MTYRRFTVRELLNDPTQVNVGDWVKGIGDIDTPWQREVLVQILTRVEEEVIEERVYTRKFNKEGVCFVIEERRLPCWRMYNDYLFEMGKLNV